MGQRPSSPPPSPKTHFRFFLLFSFLLLFPSIVICFPFFFILFSLSFFSFLSDLCFYYYFPRVVRTLLFIQQFKKKFKCCVVFVSFVSLCVHVKMHPDYIVRWCNISGSIKKLSLYPYGGKKRKTRWPQDLLVFILNMIHSVWDHQSLCKKKKKKKKTRFVLVQ